MRLSDIGPAWGFALTVFLASVESSLAAECFEAKVRFFNNGAEVIASTKLCRDLDSGALVSEECPKPKKCAASRSKVGPVDISTLIGPFGSPGFALCRKFGGQPQLVDFFYDGKWQGDSQSVERCLFSSDRSFVEIEYLFYLNSRH